MLTPELRLARVLFPDWKATQDVCQTSGALRKIIDLVRKSDGARAYLRFDQYGLKPGRWELSGHFNLPGRATGYTVSHKANPEISFDTSRNPVTLRADIARRFLTDFDTAWLSYIEKLEARETYEKKHRAKIVRMSKALGVDAPRIDRTESITGYSRPPYSERLEFTPLSDGTFKIDGYLPDALAYRLARMIRKAATS